MREMSDVIHKNCEMDINGGVENWSRSNWGETRGMNLWYNQANWDLLTIYGWLAFKCQEYSFSSQTSRSFYWREVNYPERDEDIKNENEKENNAPT